MVAVELRVDLGGCQGDTGVGHAPGSRILVVLTPATLPADPSVLRTAPGCLRSVHAPTHPGPRLGVAGPATAAPRCRLRPQGGGQRGDRGRRRGRRHPGAGRPCWPSRRPGRWPIRPADAVVVGCDSMLEFERPAAGQADVGRPGPPVAASPCGVGAGTLFTGHCVIDEASGRQASGVAGTTVRFGVTTDAELDAYLATGEAMGVAGGVHPRRPIGAVHRRGRRRPRQRDRTVPAAASAPFWPDSISPSPTCGPGRIGDGRPTACPQTGPDRRRPAGGAGPDGRA